MLITLELIPGDVGRKAIRQEDLSLLGPGRLSSSARPAGRLTPPVDRPGAIDVDAGIDRVAEQTSQRRPAGPAPFQLALRRSPGRAHRHLDIVLGQVAQHPADGAKALEQLEHHTDHALSLLVGVERHFARRAAHITHRQRLAELPPPGLGVAARQHPRLDDVQFCFRHRPLQPKQQTIVEVGRIIHAVNIGDQGVEQRADLQQLVPVPARSRQAGHLDAQNQPDMAKPHFRHQTLETQPPFDAAARPA